MDTAQLDRPGRHDQLTNVGLLIRRLRDERQIKAFDLCRKVQACGPNLTLARLNALEEGVGFQLSPAIKSAIMMELASAAPLSTMDEKILTEWVVGTEAATPMGVEPASGPEGQGRGAVSAKAEEAGAIASERRIGVDPGSPAALRAVLDAHGLPFRGDAAESRSGGHPVAISGVTGRPVTLGEAAAMPGLPRAVALRAGFIQGLMHDRCLVIRGDVDEMAGVPDTVVAAAWRGESVAIEQLDRIVAVLDRWAGLTTAEWVYYLSATFAIDGWNPHRCVQLLRGCALMTGVAS